MTQEPSSLLEHALAYEQQGYSVIPLGENSKKPAIDWQQYSQERATPEQIRKWWEARPACNIGLVMGHVSGMVAIDVDDGADPRAIHREDPTGLIASTPNGGFHLFYRYTNGGPSVQTRAGVLPSVDVRGDGGYVVAAPSVIDGRPYRWESSGKPGGHPPAWAAGPVGRAAASESPGERPQQGQAWVAGLLEGGAAKGERNQSLTRLAGYFAKLKMPQDIARQVLGQWNATKLAEPLPQAEFDRTVRSVYDGHRARQGAAQREVRGPWAMSLGDYGSRFAFMSQDWLVEDWLPQQTCALLVSPPGTFKTWLLTDLAVAIATGTPFLGKFASRKGPVLFIQQEDPHLEILSRFACCYLSRQGLLTEDPEGFEAFAMPHDLPIYIHPHRSLNLEDPTSIERLREVVHAIRPAAVMIDPLYSTASTDDFMAKAAGRMLAYKELRDDVGCSFIIAHHTKKVAESTDRLTAWGSQFLNAWLETGWQIRPGSEDSAVVRRHFKVSESAEEVGLRFDIGDRFDVELVEAADARQTSSAMGDDILMELQTHGPRTVNEVAKSIGKAPFSVRRSMKRLADKGVISYDEETSKWSPI